MNRLIIPTLFTLALVAGAAWAETMELVTYYPPAIVNAVDPRLRSVRVGTGYNAITVDNGQVLIQTSLGIGTGFGNNQPANLLELRGAAGAGAVSRAVFLPGTGGEIRMGIGTNDPQAMLHLQRANNNGIVFIERTGTNPSSVVVAAGADQGVMGTSSNDPLMLQTNNATRVRIASGGNVGIGTAADATQLLEVAGNIRMSGTRSVLFTRGDNTTTHLGGIQFLTPNNGVRLVMTPTDQNGATVNNSTLSLGGLGSFNANTVSLAVSGNLGVGQLYAPATAVPAGGAATGNLDVSDIYLRAANGWVSQIGNRVQASTFVGNGAADRFIPTIFHPRRVLVWQRHDGAHIHMSQTWEGARLSETGDTNPQQFSFHYSDTVTWKNRTFLRIVAGESGFHVGGGGGHETNAGGTQYWTAWE